MAKNQTLARDFFFISWKKLKFFCCPNWFGQRKKKVIFGWAKKHLPYSSICPSSTSLSWPWDKLRLLDRLSIDAKGDT
jgi:hypothetical protein